MSEWISVEDDKPDNGARVLFTWINVLGNPRLIYADVEEMKREWVA